MVERARAAGRGAAVAASALPRRERCALCAAPVTVAADVEAQACDAGHALHRCCLSMCLLPIAAWRCGTCSAARAAPAPVAPVVAYGLLHAVAPPGVCGLCGSACSDLCAEWGL